MESCGTYLRKISLEMTHTKITNLFQIYIIQISAISSNVNALTHWGRVTHISDSKLTIIGSDNGLSPDRRQAIIWTNVGILLIGPLGTNFSEMLIEIHTFSFKKIDLKMSSGKWRPFCLGLNVLTAHTTSNMKLQCLSCCKLKQSVKQTAAWWIKWDARPLQHIALRSQGTRDHSTVWDQCNNSETCIKQPLNFMVSQDRWSFTTGRINMILWRLCQINCQIYVFLVRLPQSHY